MLTKSKDHCLDLNHFRAFRAGMVITGTNGINHFSQAISGPALFSMHSPCSLWLSVVYNRIYSENFL